MVNGFFRLRKFRSEMRRERRKDRIGNWGEPDFLLRREALDEEVGRVCRVMSWRRGRTLWTV
jgi:hypothetical protein